MEEPKPFIEQRALSELGIFLIRKIPGLKKKWRSRAFCSMNGVELQYRSNESNRIVWKGRPKIVKV